MQQAKKLNDAIRCETCGHQYTPSLDRCPRCSSNQRTVAYAMNLDRLYEKTKTSILKNGGMPPFASQQQTASFSSKNRHQ